MFLSRVHATGPQADRGGQAALGHPSPLSGTRGHRAGAPQRPPSRRRPGARRAHTPAPDGSSGPVSIRPPEWDSGSPRGAQLFLGPAVLPQEGAQPTRDIPPGGWEGDHPPGWGMAADRHHGAPFGAKASRWQGDYSRDGGGCPGGKRRLGTGSSRRLLTAAWRTAAGRPRPPVANANLRHQPAGANPAPGPTAFSTLPNPGGAAIMKKARRDDRVGLRCSPAKRVWGETPTEGSNPSLSATSFSG